jgi:FkbM family methyltransferase
LSKVFRPILSYSDYEEDLLISKLAPKGRISYIDIGAGHPIIGNNTYLFYKLGHSGISVEPIRYLNNLHRIFRRKDIKINALVSDSLIPRKFYEFNPMQYSTTSSSHYELMYAKGMRARKIYMVESVSISSVLKHLGKLPFFISIDCEGYDLEILKQINSNEIENAFAIIVEMTSDENNNGIYKRMIELGFKLHCKTGKNAIFERTKSE